MFCQTNHVFRPCIHHGRKGCALIVLIVATYCRKDLARFSSGVMWVLLCDVLALHITALMRWVSGAVCILVHDCSALFLRWRCIGGRDVSNCSADITDYSCTEYSQYGFHCNPFHSISLSMVVLHPASC